MMTAKDRHDEIKALLEEIRDRLPQPEGVNSVDYSAEWDCASCGAAEPTWQHERECAGEPVEPGDLRAGDWVAFTWWGDERITCTLVSVREGAILRSDTPDKDDYYPNVVVQGKWCSAISDVRLIERAPREDDTVTFLRERVSVLIARAEKAEAERDEWKARHETLRVYVEAYRNATRTTGIHARDVRNRLTALRADVESLRDAWKIPSVLSHAVPHLALDQALTRDDERAAKGEQR